MTDWAPATEAEAAMRDALRADDQEQYFRILARVDLLLPIAVETVDGRAAAGWGTWTAGGRTHVLAFTSLEAMRACLAEHAGSARTIPYHELAAGWPNLEWWLAVNPGLPIEGYLPAWFVSQVARGDTRLPGRPQSEQRAEADPARGDPARGDPARSEPARGEPGEPAGRARATVPPASAAPAAPPPAASSTAPPEAVPSQRSGSQADPEPSPEPAASLDPDFEPANALETQLLAAASSGQLDHFLSTLLLAKVLLPVTDGADPQLRPGEAGFGWRTEKIDGEPYVVVFTSPERFASHLAATEPEVDPEGEQETAPGAEPPPTLAVRFVQLIRAWPDQSWSLAVNPGTPIGMSLPSSQITRLASSAEEVGLDDDAGEASESGAGAARRAGQNPGGQPTVEQPVPMQKVVAPSQVAWYLERSYDRVSGFVHREQEVSHLRTPPMLMAGLGLRFEGSLFDPDASEVYVLRWRAYRPSLYRIPYGGRTEAAMAAMEGWVIERAPFRGNGFAPSDSDDVIAEFKVDSIRLPHGAELWRVRGDGSSQLVARLDADGPTWHRVEEQ